MRLRTIRRVTFRFIEREASELRISAKGEKERLTSPPAR